MRKPARAVAAALLVLALSGAVAADVDAALAPPEGATLTHAETRAFDAVALPVRPAGDAPVTEEAQGRVRELAFRLAAETTPAAVTAFYAERLAALGFETVLDCAEAACGGFAFRRALTVLPQPKMAVGLGDFRQLTMRRDGAAVSILASRLGAATHVQVVSVESAEPPLSEGAPAPAQAAASPGEPAALGARLDAEGRVALDGVAFEAGSTRLASTSGAALDAVAALLVSRPDLAATVVGHTDADGDLALNLRISRERAEAVVAALVARGVAAERLSAEGVAFLAPRASNATEAGRAANRRVELVAR
jgi:OOP family OmpA-OmpF porin